MPELYPAKLHRDKLFQCLKADNAVVYIEGDTLRQRHTTDRDIAWRQESNFYWVSGLEVPGSFVVLTKDRLALFVPPIDKDAVMWNGLPQALDLLRQTHDADIVETSDELSKYLERVLNPNATLFTFDGVKPPVTTPQLDQSRLLLAIETARLTKTPFEIARLKEACQVSSEAHRAVMEGVGQRKFKSEYEIAAYFQYKCAFKGSRALAYESIVAYGPSSATMHYVSNRQHFDLNHGQLLLLDAGGEMDNYAADITRTFPVGNNGRFTEKGKAIYQLVLRMQDAAFARIKAGASWRDIHLHMHRIVIEGLLELGVLIPGPSKNRGKALEDELYEKNLSVPFLPHGLGHNLGLDVHDCPIGGRPDGPDPDPKVKYLRIGLDLLENQVVTVEPGCYFNIFLLEPYADSPYINHDLVKEYIKVGGVRIEDDVVVTKDGYTLLTTAPRDIESIEKLTASS